MYYSYEQARTRRLESGYVEDGNGGINLVEFDWDEDSCRTSGEFDDAYETLKEWFDSLYGYGLSDSIVELAEDIHNEVECAFWDAKSRDDALAEEERQLAEEKKKKAEAYKNRFVREEDPNFPEL